ncbi:glycosyltransferase family 2 protein [Pseudidiomarina salilacus]|uniref:glycosyltransferase family 2 protein n=1 Tax=Pseudidiomarina salilacus TaxID=3384452 RepID=UPI0039854C42
MSIAKPQSEPFFSIVIPVYNRADVITDTLDSVKAQDYPHFEVIIVDDCSKDSVQLQDVLEAYRSHFSINYIRHETNLHGAAARNTGIRAAKGTHVALLDSDDVWTNDKLSVCARYFIEHPDIEVTTSQILTVEHGKQIKIPAVPRAPGVSVADYLLYEFGSMQTSSIVVRTDVAQRVLFDGSLKRFQDYDFTIALDRAGCTFGYIEQALVVMTDNDQGNRIRNSTNLEPLEVWMKKVKPLISARAYETFKVIRYVRCLLANKQRSKAISELLKPRTVRYCKKSVWLKMLFGSITPFGFHDFMLRLKRRF